MNFPNIHLFKHIAVDTETTGLNWWKDEIFGFSLSTEINDYYWDVRENPNSLTWLKNEMKRYKGKVIFHNAKFDLHMARESGANFNLEKVEDTMIRAALIDEHRLKYDLDSLGNDYCGVGKATDIYQELADIFGGTPSKNVQMKNLSRAPVSLVSKYAKQDTHTTLKLWVAQEKIIQKQNLSKVYRLEQDLIPVFLDMEYRGIRVDVKEAEKASEEVGKIIIREKKKLNNVAGFPVNPNPSGSIHKLFAPKLNKQGEWILIDGTVAPSTAKGKASINADVLRAMKHPAAPLILKIRKLNRTKTTFIDKYILGYQQKGYIHTNYNSTKTDNNKGATSGRLSANDPALHQIPKRDKEIASIVRKIFLPDIGQVWHCRDWAQMDFRMFAHYLDDPYINSLYAKDPGHDFHQIAADITGLPRSARFSGDPNAKQVNLGLVFGMGPGRMAKEMHLPYETKEWKEKNKIYLVPGKEAEEIFEKYHTALPGVKALLDKMTSVARSRGYVKTIYGRHMRFPGGKFTYKAGSLIFQGSAADALKVKLVEVYHLLKGTEGRLLLNVHDEFDTSLPKNSKRLNKKIKEVVETFDKESRIYFRIPILSDDGEGKNWWEACK